MPLKAIEPGEIDPAHPARVFASVWHAKTGGGSLPGRRDLDLLALPDLLPWMMILERLGPPTAAHYRYRLCGSGCADLCGFDYTGRLLGEGIKADAAAERHVEFQRVLLTQRPAFSVTSLPVEGREFVDVYRAVFPLRGKREADQLLFVLAPVAARCEAASARTRDALYA